MKLSAVALFTIGVVLEAAAFLAAVVFLAGVLVQIVGFTIQARSSRAERAESSGA